MTTTTALLTDKTAIIYGAGGTLGRATAQTFSREGATLYLAGRTQSTLDETAAVVAEVGGSAHTAVLDATEEAAVRVVDSLDEAIEHVQRWSSGHTEAIVTESQTNARRWVAEVDAAAVMVNASTRFTDGGEFGFGAEIGISTQKLHARGPMGLAELTTTKWVVTGDGQIRS